MLYSDRVTQMNIIRKSQSNRYIMQLSLKIGRTQQKHRRVQKKIQSQCLKPGKGGIIIKHEKNRQVKLNKKYPHFDGTIHIPTKSYYLGDYSRLGVQQVLECNRSVECYLPIIHQSSVWTNHKSIGRECISMDLNAYSSNLSNEDAQHNYLKLVHKQR